MSNTPATEGAFMLSFCPQMLPPLFLKAVEALVKARATRSHVRNLVRLGLKGAKEGNDEIMQ